MVMKILRILESLDIELEIYLSDSDNNFMPKTTDDENHNMSEELSEEDAGADQPQSLLQKFP
mgnify:CR=1 FL=1